MARTAPNPSIGQIEQARISIQNGWTHGRREKRRREAHAKLDWFAGLLRKQVAPASRFKTSSTMDTVSGDVASVPAAVVNATKTPRIESTRLENRNRRTFHTQEK